MSRQHRTLISMNYYAPLKPDDIPPKLLAVGWQFRDSEHAERVGPDGRGDAWVSTGYIMQLGPRKWAARWGGSSACPHRWLKDGHNNAVHAMQVIEAAEAAGPLSSEWNGQRGAPEFDGWTHEVRQKRDVWYRPTPDNRPMIVYQLPTNRLDDQVLYRAWIEPDHVKQNDENQPFGRPYAAIRAAEVEVGLSGRSWIDELMDSIHV